ncbi:MAG TPA: adenylate/guanylate cyclase domain-containing protein [Candidatus Limnocylindrales bacterium]|nr:adenylate/guanylate cyclase domain-containing protein [Candidatus Limnocylindrales bacterium]
MPRLQRKSFARPDRARILGSGRVELVDLDETVVGRVTLPAGWRWSIDVQPAVQTSSCQTRHVSYAISGTLHVVMDDGTELDIRGGDIHEIPPGHEAWVVGDEPYVAVEWANSATYGQPIDDLGDRTLATVMFTDIVDSTATLARIGDAQWRRLLLEHNARLRGKLDQFRGREVATTGDGFVAIFDAPARAVRCAAAIGPAVADLDIRIRAGLHTGEIEFVAGSPRGLTVHAAARIAALAGPGEVFVSGTTRDLVEGSGLAFDDRGAHELKGIVGPRQIFALHSTTDPPAAG